MIGARGELLHRALQFRAQGRDAYQKGDLRGSARSLGRASRLASVIGADGRDLDDDARFWLGAVLHTQGRLMEALAAWAPGINRVQAGGLTQARYMAMTRYLLVAVDVPLPLARIEAAFREVEECLRIAGGALGRSRSRVLLARARLALFRGRSSDAIAFAQEGVALGRIETAVYNSCSYYRTLVLACLAAGELDMARSAIEAWETSHTHYADSKRVMIPTSWASYFRKTGDTRRSLDAIMPYEGEIRTNEDLYVQIGGGTAFVRACIAAGCPERARPMLARMATHRRTALGEAAFEVRLLLLDFHVAMGGAVRESASARTARAVVVARREAERLDKLLHCGRHVADVDARAPGPSGVERR